MVKNQRGFALIETALIIIVLGVLGATGWYAWHTKHQTDQILANATKASQSTPSAAKTNSTAQSPKYFELKEWGVRALYSGALTMEYKVNKPTSDQASSSYPDYALFSSTQLDSSDPNCGRPNYYGGALDRYKSGDEYLTGDAGVDSGKTAAKYAAMLSSSDYGHVGDYYYFYVSPQAVCGEAQSSQDLETQTQAAVKSIMTGLQAIPQ